MGHLPDIAIIGPGKVGTSIALLAKKNGYRISALFARNPNKAKAMAKQIGDDIKVCGIGEAAASAQLVLITVSDSAIASVCDHLAHEKSFSQGQIVAHCSGALSSDVLDSARLCGAQIGSFHPLQMFPTVEAALANIPGSHWFCEGDAPALNVLEELVEKIGGIPHTITAANKALYHCSSVIACNYLNALMDIALNVAEQAGLERKTAWRALLPLVNATITNIDKLGTAQALTGPIERGDAATVEHHLQALTNADPEIVDIYKALANWTIRLAQKKQSLKPEEADQLKKVLAE
jgi:predicted short-subunit dehydrogenase-like oxidoreductase (DUF2520 family)